MTGLTGNVGNSYIVPKMMCCMFPLVVILTELAVQLRERGLVLRLDWIPRDQKRGG